MTDKMPLSRRRLLTAAAGAGAMVATPFAAGCTTQPPPGPGASPSQAPTDTLPAYQQFEGLTPDLPGTDTGVIPGFLQYPAEPVRMTDSPPGNGGPIHALCEIGTELPNPASRNPFWQALNESLNVDLQITALPPASYTDKLATTVAGGDIPDVVEILNGTPNRNSLLEARFHDLTDHLGGDAVKDYPALANIPTPSWRNVVSNGKIVGVPLSRPLAGNLLMMRADILEDLGLTDPVESGEDFLELCRELTSADKNRWALGLPNGILLFVKEMTGAPNGWRETDGNFVRDFETDEMKQAVQLVADMWEEGLFHPDAFQTGVSSVTWFGGGRICAQLYGAIAWETLTASMRAGTPELVIGAIPPPKFEGGGMATKHLGTGAHYGFVGLKTAEEERIAEVLRVLDWLAAPFGTAEHLQVNYGIEGTHYELDGSNPVPVSGAGSDTRVPLEYICAPSPVLYSPGDEDLVRRQHEYQAQTVPDGIQDATVGLYSPLSIEKGRVIDRLMNDLISEIIRGQKTMADWDAALDEWRSAGGDEIRQEFEAAFQQQ